MWLYAQTSHGTCVWGGLPGLRTASGNQLFSYSTSIQGQNSGLEVGTLSFILNFCKEVPYCLLQWIYCFSFPPIMLLISIALHPYENRSANTFGVIPPCAFNFYFFNVWWIWDPFLYLLAICLSSLEKILFKD